MAQFPRSVPAQAIDFYDRAIQQTMNMSSTTLGGLSKGLQSMADLSYDATHAISPPVADFLKRQDLLGTTNIASSGAQIFSNIVRGGSAASGVAAALGSRIGGASPQEAVLRGAGAGLGSTFGPVGAFAGEKLGTILADALGVSIPPEQRKAIQYEMPGNLNIPDPPSVAIEAAQKAAGIAEKPYAPEFDWGFGGKDVGGTTDPGFGAGMTTPPTDFSDIPIDYGQDDPSGDDQGDPVGDTGSGEDFYGHDY